MTILASSDMHGNLDGINLDGIDIALFAGDIAPLRGINAWDAYDQLEWMNTEFYDFCSKWPTTSIAFVPGNHDFFPIIKERFGSKLHGHSLKLNLAANATMLIDKMAEIKGLKIYGTPWVPIISHRWAFESENDSLKKRFSAIPKGVDILLTHTPPRINYLGVSLAYGIDSDNFGCGELAEEIVKKEPKMCFCGHIHSGSHSMAVLGKTHVWNVSRVDESYEIAYEPTVIDV